ncbi:MAG: hypothetical protein Q8R79_00310 [Legionellaceae bacterium]|nr:hypothetical protein [Legionellaceae bacterium]
MDIIVMPDPREPIPPSRPISNNSSQRTLKQRLAAQTSTRVAQRVNVSSEVVGALPALIIPAKVIQTVTSVCAAFWKKKDPAHPEDITFHEKAFHISQASISLAQLVLSIYFYIHSKTCSDSPDPSDSACKIFNLLFYIYAATVILGTSYSEWNRADTSPENTSQRLDASTAGAPIFLPPPQPSPNTPTVGSDNLPRAFTESSNSGTLRQPPHPRTLQRHEKPPPPSSFFQRSSPGRRHQVPRFSEEHLDEAAAFSIQVHDADDSTRPPHLHLSLSTKTDDNNEQPPLDDDDDNEQPHLLYSAHNPF